MGQLFAVFSSAPSLRSWRAKREDTREGKDNLRSDMFMFHAAVLLSQAEKELSFRRKLVFDEVRASDTACFFVSLLDTEHGLAKHYAFWERRNNRATNGCLGSLTDGSCKMKRMYTLSAFARIGDAPVMVKPTRSQMWNGQKPKSWNQHLALENNVLPWGFWLPLRAVPTCSRGSDPRISFFVDVSVTRKLTFNQRRVNSRVDMICEDMHLNINNSVRSDARSSGTQGLEIFIYIIYIYTYVCR